MLQCLKQSLKRTRAVFTQGLASLFLGKKQIDAELFESLETLLLSSDVGVETTQSIMQNLTAQVSRRDLKDPALLLQALQNLLIEFLQPYAIPLKINTAHSPFVILFIGINGAGKTTTIGKLAKQLQLEKKQVLLAAGDTFRAAAVEQLQTWGERNAIPVVAQKSGADSAAVIFDALQAAKARKTDVLLADTAGRLHTQNHLIEELKKVKRVISRVDASAPHEVLLILDASIGQNGLIQAKQFHQALGVTGLIVTKMDGTAKGGVLFSIAQQLKLPIRFIGTGEAIDDLAIFDAREFVEAILAGD
ncbi:MAG TPA: signal recognition particle-docking protein FtsY [Gammaproteobacteria bacterium]|nr:signal recognition particle-docking protein FtsY [Gammaproteobacteria bacterium]